MASIISSSGRLAHASASFKRPNDTVSYSEHDLVANSTAAAQVVPMAFLNLPSTGEIEAVRLSVSGPTNPFLYACHFFATAPVVQVGDNETFSLFRGNGQGDPLRALRSSQADYIGSVTFGVTGRYGYVSPEIREFSDSRASYGGNAELRGEAPLRWIHSSAREAGPVIYAVLETKLAYAPMPGETYKVDVWAHVIES